MNKEESLALYEKGRNTWNAWANNMLAKKAELEKAGQWQTKKEEITSLVETEKWKHDSKVDFAEHVFEESVNFSNFIFPDSGIFDKVTFDGGANFNNTIFGGNARFNKAKFNDIAEFKKATFNGDVRFNEATFKDIAMFNSAKFSSFAGFNVVIFDSFALFENATFSGNARFNRASFETYADFNKTNFESNSSFLSIEGRGHFSFRNAKFHIIPDFNQAHFTEAPQFDDVDFSKALQSEGDFSSRWRSLKRLAIQGHDHERELFFFAEEIKSQRGIQDKVRPHPIDWINNNNNDVLWPGGARYWLGYLYEYSSNFGRSVVLPLFWLLALGLLFYLVYFGFSIDPKPQETISCNQSEAAIYLSVRSALPFLPAAIYPDNLSRNYDCLYGKDNAPSVIVFISIFQAILSTILIFLLLLALRNHFRIK